MSGFDPRITLQHLQASYGVPRQLAADFDERRRGGTLASFANSFVDTALECMIAGWTDPVPDLLERAEHWLQVAIEQDEREPGHVQNLTEAMRYRTLAMCRWLFHNTHDKDIHRQIVAFSDAYYSAQGNLGKQSPDIALPDYINAHAYESAVALYERSGRKPPRSARSAVREGCVCYVMAQHHLGLTYPKGEDVNASTHALLMQNVGAQWLDKGHNFRTATWMKIAHWNPGTSAASTVIRCYDYLPGIEPPNRR